MAIIAKIWRAGCIIRAGLLADISIAFTENKKLQNLLVAPAFIPQVQKAVSATRELVAYAAKNAIPMAGLSNSLTYFDAYTASKLPLNLIQAQRDHFGSHTYERNNMDGIFHTKWGA
jgi:6-phosphogluconate dehydrogenase